VSVRLLLAVFTFEKIVGGMNMLRKVIVISFTVMLSNFHHTYAGQVKPISDMINSGSIDMFNTSGEAIDTKMQSCESDNTAVVTIYSTTGKAQVEIDVKLDNSPVGSLSTYFPNSGPECKSPASDGIITIVIPAGEHTLEAESLNLLWPGRTFYIRKCECKLLPLS
jgi:hypothetical protein